MVGLEVRLRLVGQHLRTFLAPDSPLTGAQRELVEATLAELPLLLAAPGTSAARRDWEERISQAFTLPEAVRIFTQIGAPEPPEGLPLPADALPAPTA